MLSSTILVPLLLILLFSVIHFPATININLPSGVIVIADIKESWLSLSPQNVPEIVVTNQFITNGES